MELVRKVGRSEEWEALVASSIGGFMGVVRGFCYGGQEAEATLRGGGVVAVLV